MPEAKTLSSNVAVKVAKKRKRSAEQPSSDSKSKRDTDQQQVKVRSATNGSSGAGGPKKKKRKGGDDENKALKPVSEEELDGNAQSGGEGIDESIGKMDGRLLADHLAQKARRHFKELTAVELNDLHVPDSAFLDTSSFAPSRTAGQLPSFLQSFSEDKGAGLAKSAEDKGSPHTIVVAPAALRAADMVRALRMFQNKESLVGKLFAKHIKLDEAKQFLQRTRIGIGVGTPQRLIDLIESGTLKLRALERIVIDGSHIDQKKRGIFDMKDTHLALLKLLTRTELKERYTAKQKPLKILVF